MTDTVATNLPEYSVSEISVAVKRVLEGSFSRVRIRGEITEFKRYPSGHLYFSLKDAGGKISGVVWRTGVARLGLIPENGLEVVATGRISSYGERSSYQLVVERMEYAGEGALLAKIERLRLRLLDEGLFDAGTKRALPFLPGLIGLVTSPQGAVLHDIRTTITRRFPRALLLWPVPVQGDGAAVRIAAAIEGFDRRSGPGYAIPRPDLLIVARGGGSLEDLAAFSEEIVLRAVAGCRIPIISAVGHETDTTLIDYVSDRRAPTPTAAAEIAVPARIELIADLAHRRSRLDSGIGRLLQTKRQWLDRARQSLPDLPGLLGHTRQRLDDRAHRLSLVLPGQLAGRRLALNATAQRQQHGLPSLITARRSTLFATDRHIPDARRLMASRRAALSTLTIDLGRALPSRISRQRFALQSASAWIFPPRALIDQDRSELVLQTSRLRANLRQGVRDAIATINERRTFLSGLEARLESSSPDAVLARGYVLVRDTNGHTVVEGALLCDGMKLEIVFSDAVRYVVVDADPV